MHERALDDILRGLATEAATRFTNLVAAGDEIPFDLAEGDGDNAFFYRYVPLTRRYVVDRSDEVRALPSFGAACAATASAGVAAAYLEARGLPVPSDEGQRAAGMLVAFIAELWDGCSEFSLDRPRLDRALAALRAETRPLEAGDVLIAPIVGLKMAVPALELPSSVRIVRADSVEAPLEAMSSEGMERDAWEPQLLAVARGSDEGEGARAVLAQLRDLISVLRLFREGGVALGPYVFAPTGEGAWRRIATGAPATRPGGYRLSEADAGEFVAFAERLAAGPDPEGALAWAVRRFELGCERPNALEGLSDHLMALRSLLESEGAVGAALPVRAAALLAGGGDRDDAREKFEAAFALERSLMGGREGDTGAGLGLAVWVEECVRTLLREAALGELGSDLGATADESLIATGLQAGDGSGAEADEWDAFVEEEIGEFTVTAGERTTAPGRGSEAAEGGAAAPGRESEEAADDRGEEAADENVTRILEPIPQDTSEIRVTWLGPEAEAEASPEETDDGADCGFADHGGEETEMPERDWLSEVSRGERTTLEWPAAEEQHERDPEREPIDTPRVRHLFPVPEDADWEVRELHYDRRRAGLGR